MLVVSGDVTPVFRFGNAGNQQFFTNVLGGGTSVGVLNEPFAGVTPRGANALNDFYNGLPAVTSSLLTGPLSPTDVSTIDLLLVPTPGNAFTASEVSALSGFLNNNGTLFLLGEAKSVRFGTSANPPTGEDTNAILNDLLGALGSGLSILDADVNAGSWTATAPQQILPHPLTTGVASYDYGATSIVSGGQPLFRTTGLFQPFTAVEATANVVPEPSSLTLLAIGVGGLMGYNCRRRRRKQAPSVAT